MPWLSKEKNIVKKFDLYLASVMLFIALAWFLIVNISSVKGDYVAVYKDNKLIAEYPLSEENTLTVENSGVVLMTFEVKNNSVNVTQANCKDKLCVHQKSISKNKETICCLPNKIILSIENKNSTGLTGEYDAITK